VTIPVLPEVSLVMPPKTLKSRFLPLLLKLMPFNRRTFNILRHELAGLRARAFCVLIPSRIAKLRSIRGQSSLKVNLGAGGQSPKDWIEVDVRLHGRSSIPWDIRHGLPFSNCSVLKFYLSHVLEHVDFYSDAPKLLAECVRCLEPNGKIRIVVPDAAKFIFAYTGAKQEDWMALGLEVLPDDMPTRMCVLNHVFSQKGEHLFAYDFQTLEYLLCSAGFSDIKLSGYRASDCFDHDLDLSCHRPYSLYVEASVG